MKVYVWLSLIFLFVSCSQKRESVTEVEKSYQLLQQLDVYRFNYSPVLAEKINMQDSIELYFAKGLLNLLDTSLTKYDYNVTRSSELILSPEKDTISADIYSFYSSSGCDEMSKNFTDTTYVEKFIGFLKPPFRGLYFMNDSNLYVVVRGGLENKNDLRNSRFKEFIGRERKSKTIGIKANE